MKDELKQLAAPFPVDRIQWKAQTVSQDKTRALAVAYIDARAVMERLDEVFGLDWQDEYKVLPDGHVECTITVCDRKRSDVGECNEGGFADKMKSAYSDAFKRAGVKWGIGRYLYDLPSAWVDYDPQRKQLRSTPQLPAWASPNGKPAAPPRKAAPPPPTEKANGDGLGQLSELEMAAYRNDKGILSQIANTSDRWDSHHGVTGALKLLGYTVWPKGNDMAEVRVVMTRQVLAYARSRNAGFEQKRAISDAQQHKTFEEA